MKTIKLNNPFKIGTKVYFSYDGDLTCGIVEGYSYPSFIDYGKIKSIKPNIIHLKERGAFDFRYKQFSINKKDFYLNKAGYWKLK